MKKKWLDRFEKSSERTDFDSDVLLGFNANIDVTKSLSGLDEDAEGVQAEELRQIESRGDYLSCLEKLRKDGANFEASLNGFDPEINGSENIGGQAGIVSNFLCGIGCDSIMYTPFLSEELVEKIDSEVLYPVVEDNLVLKRASSAVNTDRTKKNYIIENEDASSRLILSNSIKGFGAYFRKSVEEKFPELQEEVDKAFFSGFHDMRGNCGSKMQKAEKQMRKLHVPKHLEFVSSTEEKDQMMLERIMPNFTSVGMDDSELRRIGSMLGYDVEEETSLGNVYKISKKIINEFNVRRVHVHTKKFHTVVTEEDYPVKMEEIRDSLVFAGLSAASMAGKGGIPVLDDIELDTDEMHVSMLDDLEHFGDFFDLEGFAECGMAQVEEYKVVAAPTLIHESPERLVGLGDVISSAAFITESY
jgi:ADP-dependent phosphofructokinase/glucokinase